MKTLAATLFVFLLSNLSFADCGVYIKAGKVYSNHHVNTQGKAFDGRLSVRHTYNCAEGTCFTGTIMFPLFNNGTSEFVAGYWNGNGFKMRRYVDVYSYVQTWTGNCGAGGVGGSWVIDPEPYNHGTFTISY